MSTAYKIQVGYNSSFNKKEVSEKLLAVVSEIRDNPQLIAEEVRRIEPEISGDVLESFVEAYRPGNSDATCSVVLNENTGLYWVYQLASGGGECRKLKEVCRRAFARLVLAEMHRAHMDVSFIVS